MNKLKETAIMAIMTEEYSDEELRSIIEHSFGTITKEQADQIYRMKKLEEAMKLIATMPIIDGPINDTGYGSVMEQIEDWRNKRLSKVRDEKDNDDNSKEKSMIGVDKPKRVISPIGKDHLRGNAAKARAAKARKAKADVTGANTKDD